MVRYSPALAYKQDSPSGNQQISHFAKCEILRCAFVRPAGRTDWLVNVQCTPGKGKCWADGNGVHREVDSEGSRRQNAGLTNRNRMRWP
jgi:hypothetical protein